MELSSLNSPARHVQHHTHSSNFHITASAPVRKLAQGNLVVTSSSQSAVFNPTTQSDSFPTSNTQEGSGKEPQLSVQQSVYGFSAHRSLLDLSDDSMPGLTEEAVAGHAPRDQSADVMVVDALSQRTSAGLSEVAIIERMEPSPHKVVCHSPRAALLSLKNSGDTHNAANVDVDTVPSIVVKSSTPEEHPVSFTSSVEESKAIPDNSDSSSATELGADVPSSLQDISNQLERTSVSQASKKAKLKPMKKTGRVVASRLMETTAAHRAKSAALSKQGVPSQSMVQHAHKPRHVSAAASVRKGSAISTVRGAHATPPVRTSKQRRQVSTPEHLAPNESFDVSALHCNRPVNRVLDDTESFFVPPELVSAASHQPLFSVARKPKARAKKSKPQEAVTQDTLDVAYARYLQWLFLTSKASKAIESEEAEVMSQLQTLSRENHKMRQKLSALDQEYDRLHHVTNLDEMLDLQKGSLGPIVHQLPELSHSYKHMASALDATRHELLTEGILIPDSKQGQEEFEGSLMAALEESGQLLTEISRHTRRDVAVTSQYSQAIDSLSRSVGEEQGEIRRCRELVKAAQTLSNQDNSLKIGEIESKRL